MPDHTLLRQWLSLRGILIPRRFIGQWLHELISEDLNVGPFVALKIAAGLLRLFDSLDGYLGSILIPILILLRDDYGRVGIASEDPLIPHEIVVDQLSKWKERYISSYYCSSGYYLYLGLGFTTFGAAENYYAIDINITYKIGRVYGG